MKRFSWQSYVLKIISLQEGDQVNKFDDNHNELLKTVVSFEGGQVEIAEKIKEDDIPGRNIQSMPKMSDGDGKERFDKTKGNLPVKINHIQKDKGQSVADHRKEESIRGVIQILNFSSEWK